MPRARKSLDDQLAELTRRQEQIEARRLSLLAAKKAEDRRIDTRRKIIVGAAILAHAELDPTFAHRLRDVLAQAVQRPIDRAVIADLLPADNVAELKRIA
jgi:hypothetical protein